MPFSPWITCLWPGVPRLWWRGEWAGLAMAAVFAAGLNAAFMVTWVMPHLLAPSWRLAGWGLLLAFWILSVRRGASRLSQFYTGDGGYNEALFRRAQEEYLKGQWFEAESLLLQLVRDEPADVEGRLILATLYRHTQRGDLAEAQLAQIQKYPHAARWGWEIRQERNALRRLADAALESTDGNDEDAPRLLAYPAPDENTSDDNEHDAKIAEHGGLSEAA